MIKQNFATKPKVLCFEVSPEQYPIMLRRRREAFTAGVPERVKINSRRGIFIKSYVFRSRPSLLNNKHAWGGCQGRRRCVL